MCLQGAGDPHCPAWNRRSSPSLRAVGIQGQKDAGARSRRGRLRIPMHPAMHSNMKPAGDSDLIPATLLASTGPFR